MGECMLSYLPSFCNAFSAHPTPARCGPAARGPLRLAGGADLQRSQPYACCTRALRSVLQPHVTCPSSPGQCSRVRLWWIPPRINLLEHQTCPRRQPAQARALMPASLHAPACAAVIVREPRGVRQAFWHTYGRPGCVPTGDRVRTYGRRPAYLRETNFTTSLSSTTTSAF
jgi:hypothetical protein